MIRVAYIGNFRHSFCTESYVASALERNGCTVERVQQDEITARPTALWTERPRRADLILYTRTHNRTALDARWTDVWRRSEDAGTRTASLHLDRFFDLEREHLIHDHDPLFTVQYVFTADGGNEDRFLEAGVNHHWMQPAIDVREGLRVPSGNLLAGEIDVVFVGSGDYHAEYPERDDLLRFLRDRYGDRFLHHGRGGFPVVREQALTDLYHAARVVVGDSCFANQHTVRNARYWSDRIPETLGRGGRLLHPWIEGMADRAWIGQLVTYRPGDWDSLGRAIDDRIDHDPVTNLGRWIARASVLANDTWDHRVRDILATVGLAIEEHA